MPIYEYRCTNDHVVEVLQKFSDDALTECQVCGAPAARVLYPAAIHFKGSGFYSTDYGRGKKAADAGDGAKSSDTAKSDGAKSEGASKPDTGSGSKSGASEPAKEAS